MRNIVITGGSSGIGKSLAKLFSIKGNKVTVLDIKKPEKEIEGVTYKQVDVRDSKNLENISKDFGHVDLLINNAAIQYVKLLKDYSYEEVKEMIDVNLLGAINVTKAFVDKLSGGLIINVGSVHSSVVRTQKIPYDVSKAGLVMFTKELAIELAKQNTRTLCVEFGAVKTPMNDNFKNKEDLKKALDKQLINHLLTSEECAEVIYELSLDKFKYMTGSVFTYDCGRSLK